MAVRGDEVASSIEAHVREAIERMVAEIHSSVDDVRAAVDSQLKAALQSVQADVNSITFLPHIKKSIAELEESIAGTAPKAAAASGGDATKLKRALQAIERGKSQVDVLNALLEQVLEFGSRSALLILRGDVSNGWKGVGFAAHGGNDEMVKRFNAAPGVVVELDAVLREEHVVEWNGASLASRFGASAPARAILIPMVIKDKVAATVYVDVVPQETAKFDRASIEILVFTTGLLVDTLAIRKKIPSPTLSDGMGQVQQFPPQETAAAASRPAAARPNPTLPGPRAVPAAAPAPAPAIAAAISATASSPAMRQAPAPRPAPAPAPAAAPAPVTAPPDERPSTQFVPPSGIQRGAAFQTPAGETAKKHDEARRFARLLVSEIKLYNESKVEQGRRSRDLYERLKEDIDRSRQMYEERIPEDVRKNSNYFYDELVRILADGDPNALGL